MLNTYTNSSLEVAANAAISFNNNSVITTCGPVSHSAGTSTVSLNASGYYYVSFSGSAAITDTTAGNVTATLYLNGEEYEGATSTIYSATAGQDGNLGFSTIVRVLPNCCAIRDNLPLSLTVVNTGLAATYSNVELTVFRLRG